MTRSRRPHGGDRMRRQNTATTLVQFVMCVLAVSCSMAPTGNLSRDKRAAIDSAIAKFVADSKVPGMAVAVVQDGQITWSAGFGLADLENAVPATPQTLFRLA